MSSTRISAADISRMLERGRAGSGSAAEVIPRGDNDHWLVLIAQQDTANPPEMHAQETDIYIAVEGTAELTIDGEIQGAREKSPGQFVGGEIVGGRTITLSAGDVVHIPAMTPHQLSTVGSAYKQFVVKIDVG